MSDVARSDEAMEIGILYRKARGSIVESVLCLREAGAKLAAIKESLPHGKWGDWLAENADALGFESERTARRLMQLAAKTDVNVRFDEDKAIELSREMWGNTAPKLPKPESSQRADDLDPDYEGSIDPDEVGAADEEDARTPEDEREFEETVAPPIILEKLRAAEFKILGLESEVKDLKAERDHLRARVAELESALATSGTVQGEKPKRGRGRPKGSKNKPKMAALDDGLDIPESLRRAP